MVLCTCYCSVHKYVLLRAEVNKDSNLNGTFGGKKWNQYPTFTLPLLFQIVVQPGSKICTWTPIPCYTSVSRWNKTLKSSAARLRRPHPTHLAPRRPKNKLILASTLKNQVRHRASWRHGRVLWEKTPAGPQRDRSTETLAHTSKP